MAWVSADFKQPRNPSTFDESFPKWLLFRRSLSFYLSSVERCFVWIGLKWKRLSWNDSLCHFVVWKFCKRELYAQSDGFIQINTFTASRAGLKIILRKLKHHIVVLRDNQHRWKLNKASEENPRVRRRTNTSKHIRCDVMEDGKNFSSSFKISALLPPSQHMRLRWQRRAGVEWGLGKGMIQLLTLTSEAKLMIKQQSSRDILAFLITQQISGLKMKFSAQRRVLCWP